MLDTLVIVRRCSLALVFLVLLCSCSTPRLAQLPHLHSEGPAVSPAASADSKSAVAAMLVRLSRAAATADFDGYFALFHDAGVFLGTDATERWTKAEFMAFARPHFKGDSAWVFVPQKQNITISPDGSFAWFDEDLHSPAYGQCRGTGVAVRSADDWTIAQYSLSVPIPNDLLRGFVARMRNPTGHATRIVLVRHAEKDKAGGSDPHLTDLGQQRAQRLTTVLQHVPVTALFATQYLRTQETVAPIASALGLTPILVDAGAISALAARMAKEYTGETLLYAGHSNTVPQLIAALGVKEKVTLTDADYDDVFVVSLDDPPTLLRLRLPLAWPAAVGN